MDPQNTENQEAPQNFSPTVKETGKGPGPGDESDQFPLDYPERRSPAIFILIGAIALIVLIVVSVAFLFIRSRVGSPDQSGANVTLTPAPTPTFYENLLQSIQEEESKMEIIANEIKEIDIAFAYESVNFSDVLTPPPGQTPEWEAQKAEIAKTRVELEVDRRITVLEKLGPKISSVERLSEGAKTILANEVTSEIANLSSIKGSISGKSDFASMTSDIAAINDSYGTYQLLVPKVIIVVVSDKLNASGEAMTEIADSLAQKTGELQSEEKDVQKVQQTLGHMLFVLGDSANKAESSLISVLPLSAAEYPDNRHSLGEGKRLVEQSLSGLRMAAADGKNIINTLGSVESGEQPRTNFFQFFPLLQL